MERRLHNGHGHEHWRDCSDIYALGALDGEELKSFQAHLAGGCPTCEAYVRETRETLNLLHRSLRTATPPPDIKARILQRIDSDIRSTAGAKAARPRLWRRLTGTLAAGVAGILVAGAYVYFLYEPRYTVYSAVVGLLRDPSTRDLLLYGAGPSPAARGRFLWNESGEGHIFVTDLPAAPAGKMYAVWTIGQGAAPRYVGTITTDAVGQGGLHISSRSGTAVETFAVTLEPDGTTAAPSGPMVLVSKQS